MKKVIFIIVMTSTAAFAQALSLTSSAVKPGQFIGNEQVLNGFGCSGKNISPDLSWTGTPKGTKSFAITMYDPDAPTGSGWWHWTVFNIPPTVNHLNAGAGNTDSSALPATAILGRTDLGTSGYGGPCPPAGAPHRYIIKVFALKEMLPLDKDASGAMLGFYIQQNKLAEGSIEAKFGK